ncbi:MAG: hypothetical protein ACLU38_13150 [Dysosmobacter sp.]
MDTLLRQIPKVDDLLRLPALNTLAAEVECLRRDGDGSPDAGPAPRRYFGGDRHRAALHGGPLRSNQRVVPGIPPALPPGRYQCHRDRSAHQSGPGLPE